jgi:hypothetical protein
LYYYLFGTFSTVRTKLRLSNARPYPPAGHMRRRQSGQKNSDRDNHQTIPDGLSTPFRGSWGGWSVSLHRAAHHGVNRPYYAIADFGRISCRCVEWRRIMIHHDPTSLQLRMRTCSISALTMSYDNGNKMKRSVADARGSEPGTFKSLKV